MREPFAAIEDVLTIRRDWLTIADLEAARADLEAARELLAKAEAVEGGAMDLAGTGGFSKSVDSRDMRKLKAAIAACQKPASGRPE